MSTPLASDPGPGLRFRARKRVMLRELLVQSLEQRWERHRKTRRRCRRDCSEESVHDLRVANRRLVAVLTLLGKLHSFAALAKAHRALKGEMHASGALRDTQVQLRLLKEITGAGSKKIRRQLRADERRQSRCLVRKLKRTKLTKRMAALRQSIREMRETEDAEKRAEVRLRRELAENFRRLVRLQRLAQSDPRCLHRARIALKKFRYVVEVLHSFLPAASAHGLVRLHRCQTIMGEIHDLDLLLLRLEANNLPRADCAGFHRRRARLRRSYQTAAAKYFSKVPPLSAGRAS